MSTDEDYDLFMISTTTAGCQLKLKTNVIVVVFQTVDVDIRVISINSSSDMKSYIAIDDGGIPYGCVICSDCRQGRTCEYCPGDCCVCRG